MTEIRNEEMFDAIYSVSPVLSQIPTRPQREGRSSSFQDEQGVVQPIDYKLISIPIQRKTKEARGMSPTEFVETAREPGIGMGTEMMRRLYEMLEKTTQKTGNVVNGPLSYDLFLDLLEKIQFDFGDDGNPIWPSLQLGSDAHAKFKLQFPEWLKEPKFHARLKTIVEHQREKYYEREACRRLVD
jgi:hypothetical protein